MSAPHNRTPMDARDRGIAAGMFLAALALRVPFRSEMAYHWDSAQFVLAVRNGFNVALSEPHAPGYFLYVMLGKLLAAITGDAHAGLVWLSVLAGSAVPVMLYLLGRSMFDRKAGVVAGWLGMTSPQMWFHSEVALTYVVDAALMCGLVWWCWRATDRWKDAVRIGLWLAIVAGVRPQSVPGLLPLVVVVFWGRWSRLMVVWLVAGAASLLWLVPMVRLSGGWASFALIGRLHAAANAPDTWAGGGWTALTSNVAMVGVACWNGLLLAATALAAALFHRAFRMDPARKRNWDRLHADVWRVLIAWMVPPLVLGTVIGFTKQQGYMLSYLPGLLLLAAVVVTRMRRAGTAATGLMVAVNVAVFVAWPTAWDGALSRAGRTASELRRHDDGLRDVIQTIRSRYQPAAVALCHANQSYLWGIRHFQLYLPEFEQYLFCEDPTVPHPPGRPMWRVRHGRMDFVAGIEAAGRRRLVLVIPPGYDARLFEPYLPGRDWLTVPAGPATLAEEKSN